MDLDGMWRVFSDISPRFPELYVAYHYFRSKGWVPKTGQTFGSDFGWCFVAISFNNLSVCRQIFIL